VARDALFGRRLAVGALHSAVHGAVSGTGGLVLLTGDAGMGKTALATEASAYATTRGATIAWGACWDGDGAPGYWPWLQVIRELAQPDDGGAAVLADLSGGRTTEGALGDEAGARFRVHDAAAGYLRARARSQPVIVVLDDLHWADVSSLRLLVVLARQLHDAAVLVIGTYRPVDLATDDPARSLLAELSGQSDLLQLTGLAASDVGELVHKVCGTLPPPGLTSAIHERTAGNPFFVQQVARLLATQDTPLDRAALTGVPRAVGEVLARRLARLPYEVVELLGVAAVAGRQFSVATIAAVANVPAEVAVKRIEVAERAGIVESDAAGRAHFAHDLMREVVDEGLAATTRSAHHLAIAERLEAHPDPATTAAELAHHRLAALPLGDRERAVAALVAAGREATTRTAFDEAAGFLRRAVEVAGGPATAELDLVCESADAHRRAGDNEAATASFLIASNRARAADDARVLAAAAFGLHRVPTLTESSRSEAVARLEGALGVLDEENGAEAGMRWRLMAALARELADGPGRDLDRASAVAAAAVDGARASGDAGTLAYALFARGDVRWEPGTASERLGIAEEQAAAATAAGETELRLEAHLAMLVARLELGDPSFAAELETLTTLAERAAIPRYLYLARSRAALLASLTGPFEKADELIDAAAAYGERIGEPDAWGVQSSQLIGLALLRHDWTRLRDLAAARGLPLTPPEFTAHERAWLLVEAGDLDAAAAVVASIPGRAAVYRWRAAARLTSEAELAAAVHDLPRCAALYEQLLPMAEQFAVVAAGVFTTGPVALQLGLLAAALGRPDDAVAHLEDAAARSERLGAALLAARARDELARVDTARVRDRGEGGWENVFRRDADTWTIGYAGHVVQLRDAKGLGDLAVLLAAPGRDVAATDLVTGVAARAVTPGADPILDDQARAAFRARLAALDAELAEADAHQDVGRSTRAAAERDALVDELAHATGLGGRRRRLGDEAERARSTVTARIRDSIRRIERVHPALGRHLRASVGTGSRCVYRPAETVRWTVSRS
jgi:hypothetical protein